MIKNILDYKPQKDNIWSGEYKIPWNDKEFSRRMLKMHLSQHHDLASRREILIDQQIEWIQNALLKDKGLCILDVGCGPGLYIKKLTGLGYVCTGIDFSPASIEYASQNCQDSAFILGDIRKVDYGQNFDFAMLLYGELNAFSPDECRHILKKTYDCLKPGGMVLLEVHYLEALKRMGMAPKSWFRSGGNFIQSNHWFDRVMDDGLFSDQPHVALIENNWLEEENIALTNFWILEDGKEAMHYINTLQGYTEEDYIYLLEKSGFKDIFCYESNEVFQSKDHHFIKAVKK